MGEFNPHMGECKGGIGGAEGALGISSCLHLLGEFGHSDSESPCLFLALSSSIFFFFLEGEDKLGSDAERFGSCDTGGSHLGGSFETGSAESKLESTAVKRKA